jgi:hypothetical protein
MTLEKELKEVIKSEKMYDKRTRKVDFKQYMMFLSLGIRIIIIYLLSFFLIGNQLAKVFGYSNFYFLSVVIGTITNIYVVFELFKKLNAKNIKTNNIENGNNN